MRLSLSLLCVLALSFGYSQSAKYSGFTSATFEGIKTEDGNLFYTTYRGQAVTDTLYSYVIQVFNADLQRTAKERVATKYNSEVVDVEGHNGGLLFYIQSSSDALIYYYNAQGKKEWQMSMELDKNKFTNAEMRSLGDKGFVIVRPDKEKKDGFRVTLYDNQMNQQWSTGQFPDKGDIRYEKVQVTGDKIGVLTGYQKSMFSNKFEKSIYMFSATDGSLMYKQSVGNQDNEQYPEDFKVNADGSAFVIGYTFGSDREAKHLFYAEYDPTGKQNYLQRFSMADDMAPKLASDRAERNFHLDKTPLINVENIRKTGSGYEVMGEKYNYVPEPIQTPQNGVTVGTSGKGKLYVMDYVILDITTTGKLEEVKSIGKPHKLVNAEGHLVEKEVWADEYYEKFNIFSYRHMTDKNGTPTMVSMNWHRNVPYIGFTSLDASHENLLNRIYLNKTVSDNSRGEFTSYTFRKEGAQTPLETYHYNVLTYKEPGKMLFYDYEGGEVSMEVMDMEVKMPQPENGEVSLTGIPAREFKGLMPIESEGYYTFYLSERAEGNNKLYVYHRFDKDLNTTGRSVISVPEIAYFNGNVSNGSGQVIVFQSPRERAWYFYGVDGNGKLISHNRIALSETANQVPTGNLLLEPASDGFVMVQPYVDTATGLPGYEVIRMNQNQQVRWNWSHEADSNEVLQITATGGDNGMFAIIHNQHPYGKYNQVSNKLMAIDDQTGKLAFEHDLYDGVNSGLPQYVKVDKDKSVVTSGMYFKGKDFNTVNSEGLFFLKLSADGKQAFYTKTPWTKVEESVKKGTETDFLISGKTKVLIEDMVLMPDGSYKVIGELFRKSLGTTGLGFMLGEDLSDRAFSIFDFVVFDYNKSGQLGKMYRIPKEEQNISLPGGTGHQRGLSLSLMMRRYNMFSYLKTMQEENQPQLIFTNTVDRKKRVYHTPLTASANGNYPSAPANYTFPEKAPDQMNKLERLESKLDKFGENLEEAVTGSDQTFTSFRDPYNGFAVAIPTEVLVYFYDPETRSLKLRLEKMN